MPKNLLERIYDNKTYFQLYGSSVYFCVLLIVFLILFVNFCSIYKKRGELRADWINQKCKPQNIPFAGFINAPPGTSMTDYTFSNFNQCINNLVKDVNSVSLQPMNIITGALAGVYLILAECIAAIVSMIDYIRNQITSIFMSVFSVVLNFIIPIQEMGLYVLDIYQRVIGIIYTIVQVMMTMINAIKDTFGSLIEILLEAYGILLAIFVALMIFLPFTLPAVISFAAVCLALLALIVLLGVSYAMVFDGIPPVVPSFSGYCFGKNTMIKLKNGKEIPIQKVGLGMRLRDGGKVTAKMKLSSQDIPMYDLNGVMVSEHHYVSTNTKEKHEENDWIPVKNHLLSKKRKYEEKYLYCLSTTTKKIIINGMYFLDWDDITSPYYHYLQNKHKLLNGLLRGFDKNKKIDYSHFQKNISQVKICDKLKDSFVIGKVKIRKNKKKLYNLITNKEYFYSHQKKCQDFYDLIGNL